MKLINRVKSSKLAKLKFAGEEIESFSANQRERGKLLNATRFYWEETKSIDWKCHATKVKLVADFRQINREKIESRDAVLSLPSSPLRRRTATAEIYIYLSGLSGAINTTVLTLACTNYPKARVGRFCYVRNANILIAVVMSVLIIVVWWIELLQPGDSLFRWYPRGSKKGSNNNYHTNASPRGREKRNKKRRERNLR